MAEPVVTGWDLGGAHLKVAQAVAPGEIACAIQRPCRLWEGLERLAEAFAEVRPRLAPSARHAVTMTGELVDLFADRAEGVERLLSAFAQALPGEEIAVYAGRAGFLAPAEAAARWRDVASANWLASVHLAARRLPQGLFVDIGSTTTDVVPFRDGTDQALGTSDAERLASDELVYTGLTRTPLMAVAERVPFEGRWQGVMAEHFATMADVYRLTGELPEGADQHATADGRDKSPAASRCRLARMLGRDVEAGTEASWRAVAGHFAERQRARIAEGVARALVRNVIDRDAPFVGAGVGRFLVGKLAEAEGRAYVDLAELLGGRADARRAAAWSAPAAAVALLALDGP